VLPDAHFKKERAMRTGPLGPLSDISRLTLGGGGLGQIWGETSQAEAVATLREAVDAGINLIDTAPLYRDCETVIADAFEGAPPAGLRFTTKCYLGGPPAETAAAKVRASLDASLAAMRLERADIYFLHTNICADDYVFARGQDRRDQFATPWSTYVDHVVPTMEALKAEGRISAWGITGIGVPAAIHDAIAHTPRPDVIQAITNLLDSAGGIRGFAEPAAPRPIIAAAKAAGCGVMGIRAVQAGALTAAIDRDMKASHPESTDYARAAPFRDLCRELGEDPAVVAHRYALGLPGVDTVVLGVKNRAELRQCVDAERAGPLEPALMARIDGLGLR
jgi:aryl-alcohol dehydrogenase-like predicted oxidoreductase